MMHSDIFTKKLDQLIDNALDEDIQEGDYSTLACIDPAASGKAVLKIKEEGIIAGIDVAQIIFQRADPTAMVRKMKEDGEPMYPGQIAFEVTAKIYTILTCERLALNCMQRMSGIATLTAAYVAKLRGYHTRLLDTRKTTPNFRLLEKEAVRIGGGYNHRFGLYDMIMLKDNHIDFCGGIVPAINKAWRFLQQKKLDLQIEVETRSLEDVEAVVKNGRVNRIMLDNFSPAQITEALQIINGQFETEASGGINLDNMESYAATGVDFISSGAIIHQAKSLDLSLKAEIIQ